MSETHLLSHGHLAGLSYHSNLLNDPLRIDAYDRAIRCLIRPGDVVLDLGCGTGILSLLAARRGARVIAVESMPVAAVAARLFASNGLSDRIQLYNREFSSLPPEPVDLVLSEFMGRFVDDDGMLPAVASSARWLGPAARFCPSRISRWLAPVSDVHLGEVQRFSSPLLGVSLSSALPAVRMARYSAHLGPNVLVSEPQRYDRFSPPGLPTPPDGPLHFPIDRSGMLDGLAGWFAAELAPGVVLETGPGHDTHWGQMVFPIPPMKTEPGDVLEAWVRPEAGRWRWSGTLRRGAAVVGRFDQQSLDEPPPVPTVLPTWPPLPPLQEREPVLTGPDRSPQIAALNQRAVAAYQAGDPATAAAILHAASVDLRPDEDELAIPFYENLGIFLLASGRSREAAQCFLRALDGGDAPEQSLRLLIDCFIRIGQPHNAARALRRYTRSVGPHPQGWTPWTVAPCCGGERRPPVSTGSAEE